MALVRRSLGELQDIVLRKLIAEARVVECDDLEIPVFTKEEVTRNQESKQTVGEEGYTRAEEFDERIRKLVGGPTRYFICKPDSYGEDAVIKIWADTVEQLKKALKISDEPKQLLKTANSPR